MGCGRVHGNVKEKCRPSFEWEGSTQLRKSTITTTRRGVLVGAAAFLLHPPLSWQQARAERQMPIEGLQSASTTGFDRSAQEGFARRLMFNCCYNDLRTGRTESSFLVNGKRLAESEMRRLTIYAQREIAAVVEAAPVALEIQ